jgi:hypothetical protein
MLELMAIGVWLKLERHALAHMELFLFRAIS